MHMDDAKIFAKNERDLEILQTTIRIYKHGIGIKLWVENQSCL